MTDKLTDRLRGIYEVGEDGEFGARSFADFVPPISLEAANRIESLEAMLKNERELVIAECRATVLDQYLALGDAYSSSDLFEEIIKAFKGLQNGN